MTELSELKGILDEGGVIILPTETVYGLAGRADNQDAIDRIYKIKGRDFSKPLAICVDNIAQAEALAHISPLTRSLMEQFWPGPLTLVLEAKDLSLDARCYGMGGTTIALRCPDIDWKAALLTSPLALTSANRSGEPDATRAATTINDKVDAVRDSGPCAEGLASTILAINSEGVTMLRQGALSRSAFDKFETKWITT